MYPNSPPLLLYVGGPRAFKYPPVSSLGYYLDKWTGPCTWAGGWLHLDKYQIYNFSERHLPKWHMTALSQVISQTGEWCIHVVLVRGELAACDIRVYLG